MAPITYVSDAVMTSRLRTICRAIAGADDRRENALNLVRDTLVILQKAQETDMNPLERNNAIGVMFQTLVALAFRRYITAHDHIRKLYYKIEADYIEDYVMVTPRMTVRLNA